MKTLLLALAIIFTAISSGLPQTSKKFGSDENLCLRNYSLYKGYYKNKEFDYARIFWNKMIEICPEYSTGIWADGEKIYRAHIAKTDDPLTKNQLIDSLLWIYDQRMTYFPDHPTFPKGYILGKKGLALMEFGTHDVSDGYQALKESVHLEKDKSNPAVILTLMKAAKELYSSGIIDAEAFFINYEKVMSIADANLALTPEDGDYAIAKAGIEQYLISSGAADCSILVKIFSDQFQENIKNSDWLERTLALLKSTGCSDTDLFTQSSVALFNLAPNASSAHKLANIYFMDGNYSKAVEFLEKGIDLGDETGERASMYYELAYIHYTQFKDYVKSREYALKASELRPNWGDPYILIGKMYIDGRQSVSNEVFEQNAVFWAAVDKFIKAKKVDPEQSSRANDLILQYSQFFPINEDVFMWTLEEGKEYVVGGWINEHTKVRSRKL